MNAEEYYLQMYEDWYNRWQDFMREYGVYIEADCPEVKSELTIEVKPCS
jgi:hypothetical protein